MGMHEDFLKAIHEKKVLKLQANTFEKGYIERLCVPYDFGPSGKGNGPVKYQFYDLDSPDGSHNLPLFPDQIIKLELTNQVFSPETYVTWKPPYKWYVKRDWGQFS